MTRIVTTHGSTKRPPQKQAKAAAIKVPPRATLFQPPPCDWDVPKVQDGEFRLIVLTDPRWNTAPLRADNEREIFVANHVACRMCGSPAGQPCFSMSSGVRVVPDRRLQFSHAERWFLYAATTGALPPKR